MATLLGSLLVSLGLDSAQFTAGLDKSSKKTRKFESDVQKSLKNVSGSIDQLKAVFATDLLLGAGKRALDYASSLGEVSQQLGVTSRDLQVYRYIGTQVGIEQEAMDTSLAKLTQTLGKASVGSKAQAAAFDALGISIKDANGHVKTAGDVIPQIADKLARIPDPAKRAALEVSLFGRQGQRLDTILSQGGDAIRDYEKRAESLGLVLEDKLINSADEAADRIAELKTQLEANISRVVAQNAGSILSLANAIATLTGQVVQFVGQYPRASAALAGLAVGARLGPIGAALGGAGGFMLGDSIANAGDDANMDIAFRRKQLAGAMSELRKRQRFAASGSLFELRQTDSARSGGTIDSAIAEVRRQTALTNQAVSLRRNAAGAAPAIAGGELDVPDFLKGGDGKGAKQVDTFTSAIDRLRERTGDLALELQALNEQWPDFQLDEAKVRADGLATAQREGAKWTDAQRAEWMKATDDLAELTKQMDIAQEKSREMGDIFRDTQEQLKDMVGKLEDSIDIEPQLEKINKDFQRTLPDLRSQWDKLISGFGQNGEDAFGVLAQGLDDLVIRFDSLGNVIRNVVQQLASMALSSFVIAPLAKGLGIPAHAMGTDFAPGGLSLVGELGPEVINIPRGTQVISNRETRQLLSGRGGQGQKIENHFHFPGVRSGAEARVAGDQAALAFRTRMQNSVRGTE